jgi:hypothetical protein
MKASVIGKSEPARATLRPARPPLLDASEGSARPLDGSTRAFMERGLGADFSRVRVHTGDAAARSAHALNARAYSAGDDVVFASMRYAPESVQGRRLLAHELAHVAQQRRGGSEGPSRAEPRARAAAEQVVRGGQVSVEALGSAAQGVYCEPNDETKKPAETPSGGLPPLTLSTSAPIDWLKMRQPFDAHGIRLSLRDAESIEHEWDRSAHLLDTLGVNDSFKLWFITKRWILDKGLSLQLDDLQARDNPNTIDLSNKDWKQSHPGGWQTPMVTIFDINWFRSKKKK